MEGRIKPGGFYACELNLSYMAALESKRTLMTPEFSSLTESHS